MKLGSHEPNCKLLIERRADIRSREQNWVYCAVHRGFAGIVSFFIAQAINLAPYNLASAAKRQSSYRSRVAYWPKRKCKKHITTSSGKRYARSLSCRSDLIQALVSILIINHNRAILFAAILSGYDLIISLLPVHKANINPRRIY